MPPILLNCCETRSPQSCRIKCLKNRSGDKILSHEEIDKEDRLRIAFCANESIAWRQPQQWRTQMQNKYGEGLNSMSAEDVLDKLRNMEGNYGLQCDYC